METIQKSKELKEKLVKALGAENAKKLLAIAPAILTTELDETIAEFPRLHKKQVMISLIERLEAYTGRKMLKENSLAPLRYLEEANENRKKIIKSSKNKEITIEDIADFFSEREDRKIEHLIALSATQMTTKEKDHSVHAVEQFLQGCCKQPLQNDTKVCDLIPQDVPAGQDSYYIVLFWMEQQYDKMLPKSFDFQTKTVGDLIKFFAV